MARFRLTAAHITPDGKHLNAGKTIADTAANAIAGDYVWKNLSSASVTPGMSPLDGSATTMLNGSRFANTPMPSIDGVNSVPGSATPFGTTP